MSDRVSLYRLWNADELLYIGISSGWGTRMGQHSYKKSWFDDITRVTLEHFDSVDDARKAERVSITVERPKYNQRGGGGGKTSKHAHPLTRQSDDSFVGAWFLGDRERSWQGIVCKEVFPGIYVVLTFGWTTGLPHSHHVVEEQDMLGWSFYDNGEDMREAYEIMGWLGWKYRVGVA